MGKQYYIIPIFVPHKGCPHDCVFCNQKKITGITDEVTGDVADKIIKDYLNTIPNKDAHIEVSFFGGSFTGIPIEDQSELLSVAYDYKLKGKIQGIRLSTRPDYINSVILDNLKKYGVTTIELGVQSMDDDVLKASNRGHTSDDVRNAVKSIRKYDFTLGLQIMPGLFGDTFEKMYYTGREVIRLKPDIVRIYPTLVIKNTALEHLYNVNKYNPLTLKQAVNISKDLLIMFEKHGIKVIRIGLQPTENITSGKDVVAGPFHPSIRQLVESKVYLDMIELGIRKFEDVPKNIKIYINPKVMSEVVGLRKENIKYLKNKYNFDTIEVIQEIDMKKDKVLLKYNDNVYCITRQYLYNGE